MIDAIELEEVIQRRLVGMRDRTRMYGSTDETVEFCARQLLMFYDWVLNGYVKGSRKVDDLFHKEAHRRFKIYAGFLCHLDNGGQFGQRLYEVCQFVIAELKKEASTNKPPPEEPLL